MLDNNLKKYVITRDGFLLNPICASYRDSIVRIVSDFDTFVKFKIKESLKIRKIYLIYEVDVYQNRYKLIQEVVKEI